ncbi:hypothetical protein DQ04_27561000, partial [Trypanosoma grayi]|uniref:hypothetical protein n=1 Tax=Trypanosoma grayi TaxID=71804 RepID=UPI0004F40AE0
ACGRVACGRTAVGLPLTVAVADTPPAAQRGVPLLARSMLFPHLTSHSRRKYQNKTKRHVGQEDKKHARKQQQQQCNSEQEMEETSLFHFSITQTYSLATAAVVHGYKPT